VVSFTPRPLYARERTPVPIELDAGLTLELVWACLDLRQSPATGIRTAVIAARSRRDVLRTNFMVQNVAGDW
jgi:hypothetical protein